MNLPFVSSFADRFLERLVYAAMLSASVLRQAEDVGRVDADEQWRARPSDEAGKVVIGPDARSIAADLALAPTGGIGSPAVFSAARKLVV